MATDGRLVRSAYRYEFNVRLLYYLLVHEFTSEIVCGKTYVTVIKYAEQVIAKQREEGADYSNTNQQISFLLE